MCEHLPLNALAADPLSEAMEGFSLRSWLPGPFQLRAPWGLRVSGELGWCYLVSEGRCRLQLEHSHENIELGPGDLLVLMQGHAHCLADAPDSRMDGLEGLLGPGHFEKREPLLHGGDGEKTTLSAVCFAFDEQSRSPLLGFLPPCLMVAGEAGRPAAYVEYVFRLIGQEASSDQPCAQTIINRLVRILLIRSIYHHAARLPAQDACWLRALLDPSIGPALSLMHRRPEEPWTVASLAEAVAMSRTAFAVRFTRTLGKSPLEYLTDWRMQRASVLLTNSRSGLKEIAAQVGYETAAAFSKAFARWAGAAPTVYRERIRNPAAYGRVPPIVA
jgi:AraC-like DNA-binding protein